MSARREVGDHEALKAISAYFCWGPYPPTREILLRRRAHVRAMLRSGTLPVPIPYENSSNGTITFIERPLSKFARLVCFRALLDIEVRLQARDATPSFGRLLGAIDYLPSAKLRQQLRKLIREDQEEIDLFAAAGRRRLVRWRTVMVYLTCAWYVLRWPALAAVWGLVKRLGGT